MLQNKWWAGPTRWTASRPKCHACETETVIKNTLSKFTARYSQCLRLVIRLAGSRSSGMQKSHKPSRRDECTRTTCLLVSYTQPARGGTPLPASTLALTKTWLVLPACAITSLGAFFNTRAFGDSEATLESTHGWLPVSNWRGWVKHKTEYFTFILEI